jgi:hypothetical protein
MYVSVLPAPLNACPVECVAYSTGVITLCASRKCGNSCRALCYNLANKSAPLDFKSFSLRLDSSDSAVRVAQEY